MSFKEYLKTHTPEFINDSDAYSSFSDAAGDFFDDTKKYIENFDNHRDWKDGSMFNTEHALLGRGVNLPTVLKDEVKRKFLRDISHVFLKNGTYDSLRHALSIAGFDVEIYDGWVQNPKDLERGVIKDILSQDERPANITKFFFVDLLYGKEYVSEDGVFFQGNTYFDIDEEPSITNIPIIGETYSGIPATRDSVMKSPYVVVRLKSGTFNSDITEYYSEETGKTYSFSAGEEVEMATAIIRYFISTGDRPTTLRYLVVIQSQQVDDEFSIQEEYDETHIYNPDGLDDMVEESVMTDEIIKPATVTIPSITVGDSILVGTESPFRSPLSLLGIFNIGEGTGVFNEITTWAEKSYNFNVYMDSYYPYIPVRALTTVSFTNNTGTPIQVFYANDDVLGVKTDVLIETVSNTESFVFQTTHEHQYLKIVQDSLVNSHITLHFELPAFEQEVA